MESAFRAIVSGQRRGLLAAAARFALRLFEIPYTLVVGVRNRLYDSGRKSALRAAVPVISVGNITLGGTGKTPTVAWLADWLGKQGVPAAIVSRGYGTKRGQQNDEALELAQKLPEVPHIQNPDRVAAASEAAAQGAQAIILDDGFQHRRLSRDLDIVLIDALEPFGFHHVFPRGTLRERLDGLARADVVVLSRADVLTETGRAKIRRRVADIAPHAAWLEAVHRPEYLLTASGHRKPIESLARSRIAAFCGIGNPAGFRHTLKTCNYDVVAMRELPDHCDYAPDEIASLERWASQAPCDAILCTHKDLVKLPGDRLAEKQVWAVVVGLQFSAGDDLLVERIGKLFTSSHPRAA